MSWSLMCYCSGRMDFNYALIDCVHVYELLLGFYEDDAFVLLVYLLCMIVLCMCGLSGVIKNNYYQVP